MKADDDGAGESHCGEVKISRESNVDDEGEKTQTAELVLDNGDVSKPDMSLSEKEELLTLGRGVSYHSRDIAKTKAVTMPGAADISTRYAVDWNVFPQDTVTMALAADWEAEDCGPDHLNASPPISIVKGKVGKHRRLLTESEIIPVDIREYRTQRERAHRCTQKLWSYVRRTAQQAPRIPVAETLRSYSFQRNLGTDLFTGLTIGVMVLPQAIAYAALAGLPPQYGLYACIGPSIVYAIMGRCPHLSFGPFALVSLLIASCLQDVGFECDGLGVGICAPSAEGSSTGSGQGVVPKSTPEQYINAAIALCFLTGGFQLLMRLFRLGHMSSLLADPVLSGFNTGCAVIIASSQLGGLLGVSVRRNLSVPYKLYTLCTLLPEMNISTSVVGISCLGLLYALRLLNQKKVVRFPLPIHLVAVIVSIAAVWTLDLSNAPYNVAVVGRVNARLRAPQLPHFGPSWKPTSQDDPDSVLLSLLLKPAAIIALMSYMVTGSVTKTFSAKYKYHLSQNKELTAYGLANIIGSLFGAYSSSGSLSRSAVIDQVGGSKVTILHNVVAAVLVLLASLFFTPAFQYMPKAVLSAIIIDALARLLRFSDAISYARSDAMDFLMWTVAFLSTIFTDVTDGILISIGASMLLLLQSTSRPRTACLGQLPNTNVYRDRRKYVDSNEIPRILIFQFAATLHFANAEYFANCVKKECERRRADGDLYVLILDASSIHDADSTAMRTFESVIRQVEGQGVDVLLASIPPKFRERLQRRGFCRISQSHIFLHLHDAVIHAARKHVAPKEEGVIPLSSLSPSNVFIERAGSGPEAPSADAHIQ